MELELASSLYTHVHVYWPSELVLSAHEVHVLAEELHVHVRDGGSHVFLVYT